MKDLLLQLRDALNAVLDAPKLNPRVKDPGSMLSKWAPWYSKGHKACYGPSDTYKLAAEWLKGLAIEDWGCGYAQFKTFHEGPYTGIDGTDGSCDWVADLRLPLDAQIPHRKEVEGILIRHILEHNPDWRLILKNAVASFKTRMVLVVFTPDAGGQHEKVLAHVDAVNVDDLALSHGEIESFFHECRVVDKKFLSTDTGYGGETIWLVER